MKCSVYIATSVDGFIATEDGGVDWLNEAGNVEANMDGQDMGFQAFISCVDCMVMGRKSMETIARMNLTAVQWPYGNIPIVALSHTVKEPLKNLIGKVKMHTGSIQELMQDFEKNGYKHAYIDGGATITSFLSLQLINEITITKVPVLLGSGIPLFGKVKGDIHLSKANVSVYPNDFVQIKYTVNYKKN